jgi:myo-inositol 2-dehydrogenase / D-chiro-inositol 1-dehydrogenase
MKIAVLGAGAHSRGNHGPALQRCKLERGDELQLVAVCDLDLAKAEAYAAQFGFARVYTELEEMVARESLDGMVALTPIEYTEEVAGRIMRLGVPLVVEKPPGGSLEQARRLAALAAELEAPHMVSFNRRFVPAFMRAQAWLKEHAERPPVMVASRMLRHARYDEEFALGTGIHSIDHVLAFMGRPLECVTQTYAMGERQTPFFDARLRFTHASATFSIAPVSGAVAESLEIVGDDYHIFIDVAQCSISIADRGKKVLDWHASEEMPEWEKNGTLDETRAFLRYVEEGGWWPTLADGCLAMEVAEAIQAGRRAEWAV